MGIELDSDPAPGGGGGGQVQQDWGRAGNPAANARNFLQAIPECKDIFEQAARTNGRSTYEEALGGATWISLTSDHPDWNKKLVDLGYPADWLSSGGYSSDMTLGDYFSQKNDDGSLKIAGLTIPSNGIVYLGEAYRQSSGLFYLQAPAHEVLHLMFGSHFDIASALKGSSNFASGIDISNLSEGALSTMINNWVFEKRCGTKE